ncbi:MAG: VOC family protein [Chitinophagaceae bacterium]|nr:VOC family protein [Chitinophagaceae bacterium]
MKKAILYTLLLIGIGSCRNAGNKDSAALQTGTEQVNNQTKHMNNLVSIIEIPVADFARAVTFYQAVLGVPIEATDMQGTQMGIIPNEEGTVNVVLAKGPDYKPTAEGTVIYINAGQDLQSMLDKIEPNGGKVLVPKTQISPEMGFFALFTDTEGNKLGLHATR